MMVARLVKAMWRREMTSELNHLYRNYIFQVWLKIIKCLHTFLAWLMKRAPIFYTRWRNSNSFELIQIFHYFYSNTFFADATSTNAMWVCLVPSVLVLMMQERTQPLSSLTEVMSNYRIRDPRNAPRSLTMPPHCVCVRKMHLHSLSGSFITALVCFTQSLSRARRSTRLSLYILYPMLMNIGNWLVCHFIFTPQ